MAGYRNCACRDCFEIAIGEAGAFCSDCEEAGCPGYQGQPGMSQECQVEPEPEPEPETGTVSHGTLRAYDLVQAFASELARRNPAGHSQMFSPACGFSAIPGDADGCASHEFWDSDEAHALVSVLAEALEECAPEDTYFGTHPGDGSDFGFWPSDDES